MAETAPAVSLRLIALPGRYAICRLSPNIPLPPLPGTDAPFVSITRTGDELSLVVPESDAPESETVEKGWRALKVAGPLDFALVGILAALTAPLAGAGISIFAVSTFDTDYLLIRAEQWERTITTLRAAGHRWEGDCAE